MKRPTRSVRFAFCLLLSCACLESLAADNNSNAAPAKADETNSQEVLRSYLQVQEQLHATQLAIEETRKEAQEAAVRNAQALAGKLEAIEGALASARARELDAMQSSNRVMLFMAGTFAAVGFVAMLLMAYFQWRTVHGLAEISAMLPTRALGPGSALAALGPANAHLMTQGEVEQSTSRLLGALEQLEKRIFDLEHGSRPALHAGDSARVQSDSPSAQPNGNGGASQSTATPEPAEAPAEQKDAERLKSLLATGQALLDQDKPESALTNFEQALAIAPRHADALVKKGTALERLQKLDEAIACYDQAIAADNSLTIAYLHKGGVFNRQEKFGEALECYERALRTQEKRGS